MLSAWTYEDAEAYLASLELYGWRFGLDRISRLVSVLGMPQHRFASIHVVGTNGKSSVTEMTAALLEAHGVRAGGYLSPHTERWSERVRIQGREIEPAAFASALEGVAQSVKVVNRTLEEDDFVTQFEAVTAAAFVALAGARVEVAVIEAGLGGRLDATNVLPSRVTALTSIGRDHTQWLGETETEIAAEKLAVLRDHTALVVGRLSPRVAELARRTAEERHATLVAAEDAGSETAFDSPAPYQRRNFAVAVAAAGQLRGALSPDLVRDVAERLQLRGRMEVREGPPTLVLDAAHNPDGALAVAEAIPKVAAGRPVVACLAVLADKDARGILDALSPQLAEAICTELPPDRLASVGRPGARALRAEELARLAREAGVPGVAAVSDPGSAIQRALDAAEARGGVALVTGSHYLLSYAWTERHAQSSFT